MLWIISRGVSSLVRWQVVMHISNHLCLETVRTNRTVNTLEEPCPGYPECTCLPEVWLEGLEDLHSGFLEPHNNSSMIKALRRSRVSGLWEETGSFHQPFPLGSLFLLSSSEVFHPWAQAWSVCMYRFFCLDSPAHLCLGDALYFSPTFSQRSFPSSLTSICLFSCGSVSGFCIPQGLIQFKISQLSQLKFFFLAS